MLIILSLTLQLIDQYVENPSVGDVEVMRTQCSLFIANR